MKLSLTTAPLAVRSAGARSGVPLLLTTLRLASVVGFAAAGPTGAGRVGWPLVLLGLGALTDVADGYLARQTGGCSTLGAFLDPLVDKVWVGAGLAVLVLRGVLLPWAPAAILLREVGVTARRFGLAAHGRALPSTPLSRAKTVAQMAVVWMLLAVPDLPGREAAAWLLAGITWASGYGLLRPAKGADDVA